MVDTTPQVSINLEEMTGLTADSRVVVNIADRTYYMKPISLRIFGEYEKIQAEDPNEAKLYIISECLTKPKWTKEKIAEQPVGLIIVLFNHLLRASFLMPPASSE